MFIANHYSRAGIRLARIAPMRDHPGSGRVYEGAAVNERPTGEGKRVVIIDDSADSVDALSMLLELEGHTVHVAYDGPSGLALIESMAADVVLCDIGLPGMNGYQVAEAVRRLDRVPRLVAVTGYSQAADRQRATDAGFDHFLVKPVDPVSVLALLASA
jgi:CheY-like chemotaxis protein